MWKYFSYVVDNRTFTFFFHQRIWILPFFIDNHMFFSNNHLHIFSKAGCLFLRPQGCIIFPVSSGCALRHSPSGTCITHLPREASKRCPDQLLQLPQMTYVENVQFFFQLLLDDYSPGLHMGSSTSMTFLSQLMTRNKHWMFSASWPFKFNLRQSQSLSYMWALKRPDSRCSVPSSFLHRLQSTTEHVYSH